QQAPARSLGVSRVRELQQSRGAQLRGAARHGAHLLSAREELAVAGLEPVLLAASPAPVHLGVSRAGAQPARVSCAGHGHLAGIPARDQHCIRQGPARTERAGARHALCARAHRAELAKASAGAGASGPGTACAGRAMKRKDWRALATGLAFTAPWIVGFSAFLAYPVLASLFYSFCDYSILQRPV